MKRLLSLTILSLLLSSHELFLKTDTYYFKAHQPAELYLFNGTFDQNENIITRDRIVKAKMVGPDYAYSPTDSDYYDKDSVTYLKFTPGKEGTYVAGISTLPRVLELSAADFQEYLEHEGLTDVITQRKQAGIADSPAREKYSKHVKALLQVSEARTNHYATELGYPVEFIPLHNPYNLAPGDSISFRLLSHGQPQAHQTVHYSCRLDSRNSQEEGSAKTDADGIVTVPLDQAGQWYVATIRMTESEEEDLDYESNWATLTFAIP